MSEEHNNLKQSIKDEISNLYRIRKLPEFPLFSLFRKPRHEQHHKNYCTIERLAVSDTHNMAQMIADGEIDDEFIGMLSERGGAVSPLYPGVLDILHTSKIESVISFATWYESVHLKYHKHGR